MPEIKQDTAVVRLTMKHWDEIKAALQYADANFGGVSPDTLAIFAGRKFEPSPQLIGQAADLIDLFVAARFVPGPVHVAITGPQGSGKTVLTAAITHALRTVKVPVHVEGSDPFDDQTPTFTIQDGDPPRLTTALLKGRRPEMKTLVPGVLYAVQPLPLRQRVRRALGRLMAALRSLRR